MNALPAAALRCQMSVRRLRVHVHPPRHSPWPGSDPVRAVEFFDLDIMPGESIVVAGESDSGKSVLARTLAGFERPLSGSIRIGDTEVLSVDGRHGDHQLWQQRVQLIAQAPLGDASPRATLASVLETRLKHLQPELGRNERRARAAAGLPEVGLAVTDLDRRVRDLTPIEALRAALARALLVQPSVLVCDAPGATLELAERKAVLDLLVHLRRDRHLALVLMAQDARPWRGTVDRVVVMYLGRIMEQGEREAVFATPAHPYTRALLERSAQIVTSKHGVRSAELHLAGEAPNPAHPPFGCVFHPRCPIADAACVREAPPLRRTGPTPQHYAACLFAPMPAKSPRA
ncbi:MAG TPA: oligopeptide/dipeptide ABC transporter ATP-binding protein [Nevskiaceae bacterium]|nr:oligopeptide/dipeptide ABC transporter ATP-binding protein [Nevskiaceae bacterium]